MIKSIFMIMILLSGVVFAKDIDPTTDLIKDRGLSDIKENCTICHPGRFIVVNGGDKRFWKRKIRLMQEGYGLWHIPDKQKERMINYLSKNYHHKGKIILDK